MDGKVTMKSKWTILFYTIMVYCSIYYKWFILAHPDFFGVWHQRSNSKSTL